MMSFRSQPAARADANVVRLRRGGNIVSYVRVALDRFRQKQELDVIGVQLLQIIHELIQLLVVGPAFQQDESILQ